MKTLGLVNKWYKKFEKWYKKFEKWYKKFEKWYKKFEEWYKKFEKWYKKFEKWYKKFEKWYKKFEEEMLRMEIEIYNKEDSNIFYKPNQLIVMNRVDFSRFQIESINIMLKRAQDLIYYNSRLSKGEIFNPKQKVLSETEMLNFKHRLKFETLFKSSSYNKDIRQIKQVKTAIEALAKINIETLDPHKFGVFNIFQNITYDETLGEIIYILNNRLTYSFLNGTCIIPENDDFIKIPIDEENKVFYTPVDINFENKNMTNCRDFSYNFAEIVFRFLKLFTRGGSYKKIYELSEFKKLIGLKEEEYDTPKAFRSKVLKVIEDDLKKYGMSINLKLLGRGKNANKIEFTINEDTVIFDFLNTSEDKAPKTKVKKEKTVIEKPIKMEKVENDNIWSSRVASIREKIDNNTYEALIKQYMTYEQYLELMSKIEIYPLTEDYYKKGVI